MVAPVGKSSEALPISPISTSTSVGAFTTTNSASTQRAAATHRPAATQSVSAVMPDASHQLSQDQTVALFQAWQLFQAWHEAQGRAAQYHAMLFQAWHDAESCAAQYHAMLLKIATKEPVDTFNFVRRDPQYQVAQNSHRTNKPVPVLRDKPARALGDNPVQALRDEIVKRATQLIFKLSTPSKRIEILLPQIEACLKANMSGKKTLTILQEHKIFKNLGYKTLLGAIQPYRAKLNRKLPSIQYNDAQKVVAQKLADKLKQKNSWVKALLSVRRHSREVLKEFIPEIIACVKAGMNDYKIYCLFSSFDGFLTFNSFKTYFHTFRSNLIRQSQESSRD
jgi:hypothetical protein